MVGGVKAREAGGWKGGEGRGEREGPVMFHLLDDVRVWSTERDLERSGSVGTGQRARNASPLARGDGGGEGGGGDEGMEGGHEGMGGGGRGQGSVDVVVSIGLRKTARGPGETILGERQQPK